MILSPWLPAVVHVYQKQEWRALQKLKVEIVCRKLPFLYKWQPQTSLNFFPSIMMIKFYLQTGTQRVKNKALTNNKIKRFLWPFLEEGINWDPNYSIYVGRKQSTKPHKQRIRFNSLYDSIWSGSWDILSTCFYKWTKQMPILFFIFFCFFPSFMEM